MSGARAIARAAQSARDTKARDRGRRDRVSRRHRRRHRARGSIERDSGVYTEVQPGSYIFMDADYNRNALAPDQHHFEQSLFVVATVMSTPVRERAIVDAGLKAFGVRFRRAADLRRPRAGVSSRRRTNTA